MVHRQSFIAEKSAYLRQRLGKRAFEYGEVGYVVAGIKDIFGAGGCDTITWTDKPATEQLTGFQRVQPPRIRRLVSGQFRRLPRTARGAE